MRKAALALPFLLLAVSLHGAEPAKMTIEAQPLGDAPDGVVTHISFRFPIPQEVPPGIPLVIEGSVTEGGTVVKRFRYPLDPSRPDTLAAVLSLPAGKAEVEARLIVPLEEDAPVIVAKGEAVFTIAKSGKAYVAGEGASADAILAEGVVPEAGGAVRIIPPRRDVAPNLFIVEVEVKPVVTRVEFWVEGKKILARNAPPWRAELDLGKLPKRVEVRAVGYDANGHYVDADAFVVNEREMPLEAKITRTVTPDGIAHFKVSVQNPKGTEIKQAILYAGQKKLVEWPNPPYAVDIPVARLNGVEFVRASIIDETNYEAADLLFLNGDRFSETIEVNLVELPVSVSDVAGALITDLAKSAFRVLEDGKPKEITSFNFASNLPISAGLLIDHSGSMKPRMAATKKAAAEFLKRIIKPGDRAFVGAFSFDPTKLAPFVPAAALQAQVDAIPDAEGGTSLYDAIITGLYRFRGLQGRKALIILTDGEDTTSRVTWDELLSYVRASRVPIYFIGIGLGFADFGGVGKMKALSAETGGVAFFIHDAKKLDETYAKLENDLRSQYLLSYDTESSKKDEKYRAIEVKVDRPGAVVRTIRGFIP
jgi:Ca-activated chloride channel homolog